MYNITTLEVKRPDVLQARDEESRRKKEQWKLRYRAEAKFYVRDSPPVKREWANWQ